MMLSVTVNCNCGFPGTYKKLRPDAVPSIFTLHKHKMIKERELSTCRRLQQSVNVPSQQLVSSTPISVDIGNEQEVLSVPVPDVVAEPSEPMNTDDQVHRCTFSEAASQCSIITVNGGFRVIQFAENDDAIQYYTGFDNYDHFTFFLSVLGPAACGTVLLYLSVQRSFCPRSPLHDLHETPTSKDDAEQLPFCFSLALEQSI